MIHLELYTLTFKYEDRMHAVYIDSYDTLQLVFETLYQDNDNIWINGMLAIDFFKIRRAQYIPQ